MRRIVRPELLDTHGAPEAELRASLADLQFVNRWFGGIGTSRWLIQRVVSRTGLPQLRILDVGAASGDGPLQLQDTFGAARLNFTLLDREPSHFNGTGSKLTCVTGDALALPFSNDSFDIVTCSLFAHHLEPDEFISFVTESLRVSRTAVLINDLTRSYFHLALVYAGRVMYRSRVTDHDAVASVWRAYTPDEMTAMLRQSSARQVEVHRSYLCRMGAIAWK